MQTLGRRKNVIPLQFESNTWSNLGPMREFLQPLTPINCSRIYRSADWSGPEFAEVLNRLKNPIPEKTSKSFRSQKSLIPMSKNSFSKSNLWSPKEKTDPDWNFSSEFSRESSEITIKIRPPTPRRRFGTDTSFIPVAKHLQKNHYRR